MAEERRPTRFNFVPAKTQDHLSTHLADLADPAKIMERYRGFGLLEIPVEALIAENLRVVYMPGVELDHVGVFGLKEAPHSLRERLCQKIARVWEPITQELVLNRAQ